MHTLRNTLLVKPSVLAFIKYLSWVSVICVEADRIFVLEAMVVVNSPITEKQMLHFNIKSVHEWGVQQSLSLSLAALIFSQPFSSKMPSEYTSVFLHDWSRYVTSAWVLNHILDWEHCLWLSCTIIQVPQVAHVHSCERITFAIPNRGKYYLCKYQFALSRFQWQLPWNHSEKATGPSSPETVCHTCLGTLFLELHFLIDILWHIPWRHFLFVRETCTAYSVYN